MEETNLSKLIEALNKNVQLLTDGFGVHTTSINGLHAIVGLIQERINQLEKDASKKIKRRPW